MTGNEELKGMWKEAQEAYPNIPYLLASEPVQHVDNGQKNSCRVF
jgi:hypothetical protein